MMMLLQMSDQGFDKLLRSKNRVPISFGAALCACVCVGGCVWEECYPTSPMLIFPPPGPASPPYVGPSARFLFLFFLRSFFWGWGVGWGWGLLLSFRPCVLLGFVRSASAFLAVRRCPPCAFPYGFASPPSCSLGGLLLAAQRCGWVVTSRTFQTVEKKKLNPYKKKQKRAPAHAPYLELVTNEPVPNSWKHNRSSRPCYGMLR